MATLKGQEAKKEFKKTWKSHINQVQHFGWNLEEQADRDALQEAVDTLHRLTDIAAEKVEEVER